MVLINAKVPGVLAVGAEVFIARDGASILCGSGIGVGAGEKIDRPTRTRRDGDEAFLGSLKADGDLAVGIVANGDQRFVNRAIVGAVRA